MSTQKLASLCHEGARVATYVGLKAKTGQTLSLSGKPRRARSSASQNGGI